LDQARLRGATRRFDAGLIDLGNEPPLSVDGGSGVLVDRRRLSIQWFTGTILTGLCGAALMGGAVFTSLDGETTFAAAPERVETVLRGALSSLGDRIAGFRKTDRLPAISESGVTRQVMHIPSTTRVHDRELVRTRAYVRISGNLSLTVSNLSANIPPFNPQKLLSDAVAGDDETPAAEPDAEVSFVTCDFAASAPRPKVAAAVCDLNGLLPRVKPATQLSLDDVLTRVREVVNTGKADAPLLANADPTGSIKLSYAADNDPDPDFDFTPRIVPENVTLLPKTTVQANGVNDWSERIVIAKKGETIGSILRELGAMPDDIKAILDMLGPVGRDGGMLKDGQKVRALMTPAGTGRMQPLRVIILGDSAIEAAVALSDTGKYVPVDIRNVDADVTAKTADDDSEDASDDDSGGVRLYQSLYETALRNNVPNSVIEDLVRIYSYDVDFQRKVQPGDSFDVLYSDDENSEGRNEVRYASLTVGDDIKKYYRFQTTDDGVTDYYDETGKSAKKFLVRKPVAIGMVTSPFGWRVHPLLHYKELHTGVDWGAPMGTPIFAAGNGVIEEIGPKGGYGKYVRIRHADGYETAYGHMTAFARGLDVGSRVRQGQVIGFVGSTGLSTGSHVHFEIIVNNRFVDPMRVKLPRGRVLDGTPLLAFNKDREQLDAVMANAPARIAQVH
jgi:murein DD-endopeptidase MepM/ murein hydrolase activator NlpD